MTTNTTNSPRSLWASDKQLAERFDVSRSTIWRWAAEGIIPKPRKLSPGCTRWKLADLEQFEQEAAA